VRSAIEMDKYNTIKYPVPCVRRVAGSNLILAATSGLSGGDLAPSLGGRKKFSADPRFLNDVFCGKKFHFRSKNV